MGRAEVRKQGGCLLHADGADWKQEGRWTFKFCGRTVGVPTVNPNRYMVWTVIQTKKLYDRGDQGDGKSPFQNPGQVDLSLRL